MVDVENMSDAELRSKLIEFGFPVLPITGTTRKTMKKKLKMLMDNQNKINKDNRRSLGRYSSEDESDSDSKSVKARDRSRRVTMAAPIMQPPPPRRKTTPKPETIVVDSPQPLRREVKTTTSTTTRTTKILQAAKDEFDTGSESDEVADKYEVNAGVPSPGTSPSLSTSLRGDSFKSSPSRLPSSFISASSAAEAASDRLSQIRSRLNNFENRSHYTSPTGDDVVNDKESTPFLSNFTKRLSQLSESPKAATFDYKSDIIKENDVNGGASTRSYLNSYRTSRGRPSTYDYKLSNQNIFKNNFVPFMVLVVAFLFFIVVAVVYLGIRSDTSLDVTATIPVCDKSDVKSRRYVNCVLEGEGKPAVNLLQVLKPELTRRALRNRCEDTAAKPYMTEDDVVAFVVTNFAIKNKTRVSNDLNNLEVLSFLNPSWGISVVQLDHDGEAFRESLVASDMEQVVGEKHKKVTALMTRNPYVPWKCYLYNTVWSLLSVLTSITTAVVVLYLCNYLFKLYKQMLQKQQEEEMLLVENIIEVLQSNAGDNTDTCMVINHVRDMILPIHERKSKQKAWARAVRYIHENESRIRTEEKVVQGEFAEVWRWVGGTNLSSSRNKTWQGQAFETSANSVPCSPTPCLKIRGMVEEGDRNTLAIKKAVLSKCANECRILHCAVDTNMSCVYLKCADTDDAAVAYRNLHGWWYAGNLVTVKYLRLERYMQRFPDSPVAGPPFLQ